MTKKKSGGDSAVKTLPISDLILDAGTQPRQFVDDPTVANYSEAMKDGADFPPVDVFTDGKSNWLAGGFHRVEATKKNGGTTIKAIIHDGSLRDAILFAVGQNATHGLPRTNLDKRQCVLIFLKDSDWVKKSDRWIAEACKVSHTFVQNTRKSLAPISAPTGNVASSPTKRTGKDGKTRKSPHGKKL